MTIICIFRICLVNSSLSHRGTSRAARIARLNDFARSEKKKWKRNNHPALSKLLFKQNYNKKIYETFFSLLLRLFLVPSSAIDKVVTTTKSQYLLFKTVFYLDGVLLCRKSSFSFESHRSAE